MKKTPTRTLTFQDFSSQWQEEILPLKKPATQAQFKSHLKLFNATFGPLPLPEITSRAVQKFIGTQTKTKSPTTVKNIWLTLRLILGHAQQEGLLSALPKPVLPKRGRVAQQWLTSAQMRDVLGAASGPHQVFYALLAETGLRIGEALALQPRGGRNNPTYVDLAKQTLSVRKSVYNGAKGELKTLNSTRDLCLSSWLCGLLAPMIEDTPSDGFVFRTSKGTPWWPGEVLKHQAEVMKSVGIEPVGFHAWRRGVITLCASELQMPETIIAQRVGHEAAGMTLGVYSQRVEGIDREWVEKIAAAIKP
jgi:integrase